MGGLSVINNNKLATLAGLAGLIEIEGSLLVRENAALISITELKNIDASSITDLTILDNPSLPNCAIESVCNYLTGTNGNIYIHNNAPGCNNQQEVEDECGLYVEKIPSQEGFTISPNPLSHKAILYFTSMGPGTITINIYNTSGICLKTRHLIIRQSGQQEIVLDMGIHPPGIYFLQLKIADEVVIRKVVKL